MIDFKLFRTTAFDIAATPSSTPEINEASDDIVDPLIVSEDSCPIDVMLGCSEVNNVPVKFVASKEFIPLISFKLFNTNTLPEAASPGIDPAKYPASL